MPYRKRGPARKRKGKRKFTKRTSRKQGVTIVYRKLKLLVEDTVQNVGAGSERVLNIQVAMNDCSPAADFAAFQGLYESVRISAIKVKWIPSFNTEVPQTTSAYTPGISFVDFNSTPSYLAYASCIPFDTMKIHNLYRPFSRYIPLPKHSFSTLESDGWQPTTGAGAQAGSFQMTCPLMGAGQVAGTVAGHHLITWYCKFKAAK